MLTTTFLDPGAPGAVATPPIAPLPVGDGAAVPDFGATLTALLTTTAPVALTPTIRQAIAEPGKIVPDAGNGAAMTVADAPAQPVPIGTCVIDLDWHGQDTPQSDPALAWLVRPHAGIAKGGSKVAPMPEEIVPPIAALPVVAPPPVDTLPKPKADDDQGGCIVDLESETPADPPLDPARVWLTLPPPVSAPPIISPTANGPLIAAQPAPVAAPVTDPVAIADTASVERPASAQRALPERMPMDRLMAGDSKQPAPVAADAAPVDATASSIPASRPDTGRPATDAASRPTVVPYAPPAPSPRDDIPLVRPRLITTPALPTGGALAAAITPAVSDNSKFEVTPSASPPAPGGPVAAPSLSKPASAPAARSDAPVRIAAAPVPPAPPLAAPAPALAEIARPAIAAAVRRTEPATYEAKAIGADPTTTLLAPTTAAPLSVTASQHAHDAGIDLTRDSGLHRMIDRIELLRDAADARDTRIRLIPDALGPVEVAVRREGDGVLVHFTAAEPATRQLIADAQPRLADLAESRGVRIERATVDAGAGNDGRHARPQPQPQPQAAPWPAPPRAAVDHHDDTRSDERIA